MNEYLRGLFVITIALGLMTSCGGDQHSQLSPTPLPAPSRLSAGTAAFSARSVAIVAVSPSSGPASGGTPVTITGEDFAEGAMVLLGEQPALGVVVFTSTAIMAITPAHAEGAVDVIVINPDGDSTAVAGGYTYTPEPSVALMITEVSPPSGPAAGGTQIMISGSHFAEGAAVLLGGWPAVNVVVLNDTTLTAITSPHEEGTVDVTVTNPDGQVGTLVGAYTYVNDQSPGTLIVTITPSGVTPSELRVPVGSRVTFVNNSSRAHDIESDPHPVHTECPVINHVGFIRPGESKQTGAFEIERTCGYHDHNQSTNQTLRGMIVVVPMVSAVVESQ